MSWGPQLVTGPEEAVSMTMLRCACCERRWLVAGDHRDDAGRPCPYCEDGAVGVLGVHRCS